MKKILTILSANLILIGSLTAGDDYKKHQNENTDLKSYQKVTDTLWESELQSSDIISAEVYSDRKDEVGTVTDLELNKDGDIEALYVELEDGLLGLFGNTVVRVEFDKLKFDNEKNTFNIHESELEEFSEFLSQFIEETKEGVDYVADNTEKGLENLMRDLENDKQCGPHMENVSIDVDQEKVYVRGEVKTERAHKNIIDKVEDNTRLEVVDDLEVSSD